MNLDIANSEINIKEVEREREMELLQLSNIVATLRHGHASLACSFGEV